MVYKLTKRTGQSSSYSFSVRIFKTLESCKSAALDDPDDFLIEDASTIVDYRISVKRKSDHCVIDGMDASYE